AIGDAAVSQSHAMRDGEVAVFGNTRRYDGEERNDPGLAKAFSEIGDVVALGGFSKAHRAHSSNVGMLRFRPGYLASSVSTQLDQLASGAGARRGFFPGGVLGGKRGERGGLGLGGFSRIYYLFIPGGVVLNCILKARG